MIEEELILMLKDSYDVNIENFNKNSKLREHLDSIDFLGFLMQVRKQYKINIEASEMKNFHTIENVADAIRIALLPK